MKAVPLTRESFDDHLDVLTRPSGHLVADELRLLEKAGLPDRAAELTQLVPNMIALPLAVTVKPIRRRHVNDPAASRRHHAALDPNLRRSGWLPAVGESTAHAAGSAQLISLLASATCRPDSALAAALT